MLDAPLARGMTSGGFGRNEQGGTTIDALARNVRRLGHLDLAGAGQVTVAGSHAYVGHIPNQDHLGTSIIDISDPRKPRVVATVTLDDHESHSHKVRVAGDIMIVNHERNMSKIGRRAEQLPAARRALRRGARARADASGDRRQDERDRGRPAHARRVRAARLSQRRLQGLRRLQAGAAEADLLSQDRRHRRAPLRHGRALRLHLDRDEGLCRQHPRHLRSARSAPAAGSLALVDARAARRGRRDADLVRPAAPAASCAALRQRDVGELLARRLLGRRRVRPRAAEERSAATITIRCFPSRRTP